MHHHLFVRVLTGIGVFDGLDDLDVVAAGAGVGGTLAGTGVLRYFSHDANFLVTQKQRMQCRISCWVNLLDLAVNGHLTQNGVVLLEFHAVGGILTVLLGNVTAGTGLSAGLVLGTLEDDEVAVTF